MKPPTNKHTRRQMFLAIGIGALALLGATSDSEAMSRGRSSSHVKALKKALKRAIKNGQKAKARRLKKMIKMYK